MKTLWRSVHFVAHNIEVLNEKCVFRPQDMQMSSVFHAHKVLSILHSSIVLRVLFSDIQHCLFWCVGLGVVGGEKRRLLFARWAS